MIHQNSLQGLPLRQLLPLLSAGAAHMDSRCGGEPAGTWRWWFSYLSEVADPEARYVLLQHLDGVPGLLLQVGLGASLHAVSNYYTPLLVAAPSQAPIAHWVQSLARTPSLNLSPIDNETADLWSRALQDQGWYCFRQPAFGNWFLPCGGVTFNDYMANRPADTRNTYARKRRPFASNQSSLRLTLVDSSAQLQEALQAYEQVYERSWKPVESHPAFIRCWARQCAEAGWLRLGLVWQGKQPIAAQFWYTAFGRAHIFKLAYDESATRLSPGTVLTGYMLQHALEVDGVQEVDYLTGDDAYKKAWMSHRRQRWTLQAFNPRTALGWVGAARARAQLWWRKESSASTTSGADKPAHQ